MKFRDIKTHGKKVKKSLSKKNKALVERLLNRKPSYTLDRLVKERLLFFYLLAYMSNFPHRFGQTLHFICLCKASRRVITVRPLKLCSSFFLLLCCLGIQHSLMHCEIWMIASQWYTYLLHYLQLKGNTLMLSVFITVEGACRFYVGCYFCII